ncbi:PLP-dependent aminotransferase family protein [Mycolicibacterium cosmeticum]|uniref:aminotransferase-like domain-containing protein n=1 Tax=Mycolicibacterium cosmeticum TaxID=258533 RepID=UPI00056B82E2|nr:PLP-dependent aminotransferase family protein [Mycolicibacterium cosmeticum]
MKKLSYTQVSDRLADQIRSGRLPAGTRLPTHRALAAEYGIAVATATKVYRALTDAGLVVGEPGRGTFVRDLSGYAGLEPRRHSTVARIADLSFNQPLEPVQADHLRRALRDMAAEGDLLSLLRQEPPGGRTREQATVATYLLGHGIDVAPRSVVLTAGGQQGLDAVLGAVAPPGSVVAVDALTYPGLKLLAAARRIELAPVPVDTDGPDLDALARLCASRRVAAIFTMPTLHNPLGLVLKIAERQRIAELARRRDAVVIEDATYAFLDPAAPQPIQALAPERTFYVGGMSKSLAPGLRFGFVVTPDAHRDAVIRSLRAASWGTSTVAARLAARWIADGTIDAVEKLRRDDARERQALARAELEGLDYHAHPASYIGWLRLPEEARMDVIAHQLAERGVLVSTADAFSTAKATPNALRLALATPGRAELAVALREVRELVAW